MNIKVEYLEEAQSYIDNMPDKARKKLFHNVGLVSMGVKDDRIFKKLTESGIWEFRAEYESNEYRLLSFWDKMQSSLVVATHGFGKKTQKTPKAKSHMQRKSEMNITKHDKSMETMTHEQMLDKYIGPIGTPERDEFEARLKKEVDEYFIGEAIKETRKKQGLTQEQLGERMGVKKSYVSKMESGRNIAYSTIMRAFKALGVPSASLDLGSFGRVALW